MKNFFFHIAALLAAFALINTCVSALEGGLRKNNDRATNKAIRETISRDLVVIEDRRNLFDDWDPNAGRWLEVSSKDIALRVPSSLSQVHRELFFKWIKKAWKKTKEAAVKVVKKVVEVVETTKKVVKAVITSAKVVVETVKDTVKCAATEIKGGNHIGIVACAIEGTTKVVEQVEKAIEDNKPHVQELVEDVKETIETAKDAVEDVKENIEEAIDDAKEEFEEAKEEIEEIAEDVKEAVVKAKEDASKVIKQGDNFLKTTVKEIKKDVENLKARESGGMESETVDVDDAAEATDFIDEEIERAKRTLKKADGEEKRLLKRLLNLDEKADKLEEKAMADPENKELMKRAETAARKVELFAKKVAKQLRETEKKLLVAEAGAEKALKDAVKVDKSMTKRSIANFMVVTNGEAETFDSLDDAEMVLELADEPKMIVKKKAGVVIPIKGSYVGSMKKCDPRKKVICRGGRLETIKGLLKVARAAFRKQDQEEEAEEQDNHVSESEEDWEGSSEDENSEDDMEGMEDMEEEDNMDSMEEEDDMDSVEEMEEEDDMDSMEDGGEAEDLGEGQ